MVVINYKYYVFMIIIVGASRGLGKSIATIFREKELLLISRFGIVTSNKNHFNINSDNFKAFFSSMPRVISIYFLGNKNNENHMLFPCSKVSEFPFVLAKQILFEKYLFHQPNQLGFSCNCSCLI